jgi:hypothetical protein
MNKATVPDAYLKNYDAFNKEYISTSMLSLLMKCGVAFKLKYIDRWHECIRIRQTAGTGAHKARKVNLAQKILTHENLKVDLVTDAARDEAKERFENNEYIPSKEFEGKSKGAAAGIATDMAVELAQKDYEVFQEDLQPVGVEESMAVEYPGLSRVIVGRLDVREPENVINDFKTGKRAYGQSKVDDSMQLSTYGMLHLAEFGAVPENYRVQNVVHTEKGGTRTNEYETMRTKEALQRQLMRFAAACRAIDAGNFIPADQSQWWCSKDFCGFYDRCKFGGGKI